MEEKVHDLNNKCIPNNQDIWWSHHKMGCQDSSSDENLIEHSDDEFSQNHENKYAHNNVNNHQNRNAIRLDDDDFKKFIGNLNIEKKLS